jgi:hypothetical protein
MDGATLVKPVIETATTRVELTNKTYICMNNNFLLLKALSADMLTLTGWTNIQDEILAIDFMGRIERHRGMSACF